MNDKNQQSSLLDSITSFDEICEKDEMTEQVREAVYSSSPLIIGGWSFIIYNSTY